MRHRVKIKTKDEQMKEDCYLEIAEIYKKQSELKQEIDILKEALNDLTGGQNLVINELLAEAYYKNGEYQNSADLFKKLLDSGYSRPYIYLNIAYAYQQGGNLSDAENILLQMQEKYPQEYKCYIQLAYVYMEIEGYKDQASRNYDKVIDNYNLALQYAPNGASTPDLIQLKSKIDELKLKGWI